ncbi:pre-RNA processing PIH1/Nop17-domain-containing protein [Irpex rosettiformis]|uniref:Pre-RNA processing PIH1/Nop17-domain-containing protein n=1 Tax=Irpex rosettiformis TaxID=378272 RepID=A0ACB8U035_9APHY|nr:pre-RNA processing PIH1/Nop17-domain-containing protein [Irpex rosettiformis]
MDALNNTTVRVPLAPSAGFCIKSTALQPAVCKVSGTFVDDAAGSAASALSASGGNTNMIAIARGQKVFINVAWDANVPPPPDASNDEIHRAMAGEQDADEGSFATGGAWFVPVIVSEPRNDLDKAGKPSIIFDCVYNSSLKSRCLRDPEFRAFLIELGIQRIEDQHSVALSRHLGTPNIASKGKLAPRTVLVPLRLYPEAHPLRQESAKRKVSLIQEVDSQTVPTSTHESKESKPKGILKNTANANSKNPPSGSGSERADTKANVRPNFDWVKEGDRIRLNVYSPNVTRVQVENATLDVEPRRIILTVPNAPSSSFSSSTTTTPSNSDSSWTLDIDLTLPDAHLMAQFGGTSGEDSVLMLKRQREFDVDSAKAEWDVKQGRLTVWV